MPISIDTGHVRRRSPLLKRDDPWFTTGTSGTRPQQRKTYPLNVWLCTLILFSIRLGQSLLAYPWPKLLFTAVCRHYYETEDGHHGDPSPEYCNDERITGHWMSMVNSMHFLAPFAAIVAQFPMGLLLDKGKARLAFTLSILSTVLYWGSVSVFGLVRVFPLWSFYLSPIFLFIGGGPFGVVNLVYATISNAVRPGKRTVAFSHLQGLSGLSGLVSPLLYKATMRPGLWVPYVLALICYSLPLIPALYLKENDIPLPHDNDTREDSMPEESEALLGAESTPADEPIDLNRTSVRELGQKLNIFIICFVCFFGFSLASVSISYTYIWVWSQFAHDAIFTDIFEYIDAAVTTILFLIALPLITARLDKTWRAAQRDLILSSAWTASCATGLLTILCSPNRPTAVVGFVFAVLGYAIPLSLRSFLASHFQTNYTGRLFAGIAVVNTIGEAIGQSFTTTNYYTQSVPFVISVATCIIMLVLLVRLAMRI